MKFWPIRILSIIGAVLGCFLFEGIAHHQSDYTQRLIILAGHYVTLAVSLNLINGITGQFSIGHAAFYQVGAYLGGYLSVNYFKSMHLPPLVWLLVIMVAGAAAAAFAGLIVGLPSLRLRGDYLAIVTLGFGEIIRIKIQNTPALGGSYGLNVEPKIQSIAIVWLLAILCIAVCRNLLKTANGLPFLAVREDEVASSAMGVNVTRIKVSAFLLGSAFAGAAGALLASYEGFITPATFAMDVSFIILTMVVLGGTGSITGSVVSAIFLSYLPEYLRGLKDSSGEPLTLTGGSVVASLIAVITVVAVIRWIYTDGSRNKSTRIGMTLGAIVGGFVVQAIIAAILNHNGKLHNSILVAAVVAVVTVAFLIRSIYASRANSKTWQTGLKGLGAILGGLAVAAVLNTVLTHLFNLNDGKVEVGQLRMVIFAITLIVLMLLRPQGVFAHHEFSWTWVSKLFKGRKGATA